MIANNNFDILHNVSFTYIINNKGPILLPCGTPYLIGWITDLNGYLGIIMSDIFNYYL